MSLYEIINRLFHCTKKFQLIFLLIIIPSIGFAQPDHIGWESENIHPGIIHQWHHSDTVWHTWQNINVLIADPAFIRAMIAFSKDSLFKTSHFGTSYSAKAGVNGSFFNVREGGSVMYLKVNNKYISATLVDPEKGRREHQKGAFIITENGRVVIEPAKPDTVYDTMPVYENVLVTGPLLLYNGKTVSLSNRAFNSDKHPRTAACITREQKLLLITVDGRNEKAAGMALYELADLLKYAGCLNAVNLDGGGSTTMWINDEPFNGVVNMPSDNRIFDHNGERACANAILLITKPEN